MNILVWNVRGAAKRELGGALKSMVSKNHVEILILLEPRTHSGVCKKLERKLGFDSYLMEEAVGFSGGIWILWNRRKVDVVLLAQAFPFIHCKVSFPNVHSFIFTAIYANPLQSTHELLWNDLKSISESISDPWILGGDFNEIAFIHEKKGGVAPDPNKCAKFASILNDCQVADLGCDGSFYTWQGPKWGSMGRIFKRLDRVVANMSWRTKFDEARVVSLPRLLSDHNPLLIKLFMEVNDKGKRPFRFFAAWQEHHNFSDFLKSKWEQDFDPPYMLQRLVSEIRIWNRRVFGIIKTRKNSIIRKIASIQKRREQFDTDHLKYEEEKFQKMLTNVLRE
ncbi:uncharacterized protein LOC133297998 [Gastrolobium bilobum]|uniref:uncharacterized protein LOC133297998 n=1 Tax=Gastrolobium bilobum TaxID=150636 RepID=UPI002AB0CDF4|nr:uncharacterized protein LOC133297998 [Gastrolobium bilobum]